VGAGGGGPPPPPRDPDTRLDLLLCDVVLADESGLALAERIRCDRPELPVLWTSGYAADVLEAHGMTGPIDLLQKPFSATELVGRVRRALEGASPASSG
jgi:two-component system cell cycle sensor histidine kinase/response regulator CckA